MPRFLARLPYGAKTNPVEEFDFEEDTDGGRPQQVHLGERRLRDGGEHQPLVQAVRLVLAHPRRRVGRRGRRPAGAHLPDRRRRRRHEVPDRDRDQRPARGRAGEERLHAAACTARTPTSPPSSARSRCRSRPSTTIRTRPPTPTWRRGCRTCSPCCRFAHYLKCIVRDKIGSFKERDDMQRWLQNWIMQLRRRRPGALHRRRPRRSKPLAAAEVAVEEVEGNPGYYTLEVLPAPALSARRPDRVAAAGVQAAVGEASSTPTGSRRPTREPPCDLASRHKQGEGRTWQSTCSSRSRARPQGRVRCSQG